MDQVRRLQVDEPHHVGIAQHSLHIVVQWQRGIPSAMHARLEHPSEHVAETVLGCAHERLGGLAAVHLARGWWWEEGVGVVLLGAY